MATQRCLYEILGVETTANNEEIRSAYRKLALKWHPDKIQQTGASAEACQEATIQFQEIGRAYEVLNDPSERSWYDSHRTQILSSSSSSSFSSDFDFNPWPYFSASAFSGYGDTGKGFFAVYGDLFTKLHQQEMGFARAYGVRPPFDPPDMGNLSTPYSQVQKFYNHWLGFSTVKDFAWCDEFKASAAPNRKLRRLIEEENKKIRSKERKEFNETIRRLAAFVKKRDKRVLERQIEVQRLEKEKEEMRKARRKREEEEKMMKAKLYEEAEWTKVEEELDTDDGSDFDDSIGSYTWGPEPAKSRKDPQDEFYCIVCSKKFKSDKQWKNHEKSKKHLEKVAILKESFEEDDREFEAISRKNAQDDGERSDSSKSISEGELPSTLNSDEKSASMSEAFGKKMLKSQGRSATNRERDTDESSKCVVNKGLVNANESEPDDRGSEHEDGGDDELNGLLSLVNSYTSRQQQSPSKDNDDAIAQQNFLDEEINDEKEEEEEEEDEEEGGEEEMLAAMLNSCHTQQLFKCDENQINGVGSSSLFVLGDSKDGKPNIDLGGYSKKKKSKGRLHSGKQQAANSGRYSTLAEEFPLRKEVEDLMQKCKTLDVDERDSDCLEQGQECVTVRPEKSASKAEKLERKQQPSSKGKNMNGHMVVEIDQQRRLARGKKSKGSAKNATNICEICGEDFESRNQLFKHINVTKHAIFKGK